MQEFTIRDIENLTGIKAHTLRIWEQRYNFFTPKRKESLHRVYNNEDLKHLLRISLLYHNGWKVSKIAALQPAAIEEEVRNFFPGSSDYNYYINNLLEAALDFDEYNFIAALNNTISLIGFEKSIVQVCYPYLVKLGQLWSTNNVIPAQEHFSSYLIQNKIISETEKLDQPARKPEIILLCPKGEHHELPLLFINYMLRKNSWGTIYLGSNISSAELEEVVSATGITMIYIHMITNFTGMELEEYLETICKKFHNSQVLVSGEGFRYLKRQFTNMKHLISEQEIYNFFLQKAIV
jgi:MerR family transcriptional regulator, light-induced transcriptional regulator